MASNEYPDAERLCELIRELGQGEVLDWRRVKERFDVSDSCAYSYMKFLRDFLGRELVKVREGRHVRYRLADRDAPTEADITRAASVRFGEIALDVFRGTRYHREANKVAGAERGRVVFEAVDDLDRLTRGLYRRTVGSGDYRHKAAELEVWLDGIRLRRRIAMRYQRVDRAIREYVVDPLVLVLYQDGLHLLSRHAEHGEHRTFNLDGVLHAELLPTRFLPPENLDPQAIYAGSFGIWSDLPAEPVCLHLRGVARVRAEQRRFHASQEDGEELAGGWRAFRYTVATCPEFCAFVVDLSPNVRIVSPATFAARVVQTWTQGVAEHGGHNPP